MGRIREMINDLATSLPWRNSTESRHDRAREAEQIAEAIVQHGRMWREFYRRNQVFVEVNELAFRLRETPQTIARALRLLENRGAARVTEFDGLWELLL